MNDTALKENNENMYWINLSKEETPNTEKVILRVPFDDFNTHWEKMIIRYKEQLYRFNKKESFYITGIRNLWKRVNYLELNIEVLEDTISEEDMISEIKSNPDKYIINISGLSNKEDFFILKEVVENLKLDLSSDYVSQTFSVDQLNLFEMEENQSKLLNG